MTTTPPGRWNGIMARPPAMIVRRLRTTTWTAPPPPPRVGDLPLGAVRRRLRGHGARLSRAGRRPARGGGDDPRRRRAKPRAGEDEGRRNRRGFDLLGFRIRRDTKRGDGRRYVYTYPSKAALASVTRKVKKLSLIHI